LILEQAIVAANEIDKRFLKPRTLAVRRSEEGTNFGHLRWMVQEMSAPGFSENKAMRWLGYIQGVVVASGEATLEEMKDLSRRAAHPE
jgi:hypothetical protein